MFGIYRTLLALAVVCNHLMIIPVIGHYAVHGFFILSGYLMTLIMAKSYGYNIKGIKAFAINRFLRLYPIYWVLLLIAVFLVVFFGEEQSRMYRESLFMPKGFLQWFQNITLVYVNFFPSKELPRLSPPTWALTVELVFYFFIALGLSRTKKRSFCWLIVSLAYMISTHFLRLGYEYRYSAIVAGSLPFSIGAMIFHFRDKLSLMLSSKLKFMSFKLLFFLFLLNTLFAAPAKYCHWHSFWFYSSFYLNYLINALIVIYLINGKSFAVSKKTDTMIGDFSYPIYLFHWPAGFISSILIWKEPVLGLNVKGIISCMFAIVICFFVSWLLITYIDKPIQNIRNRVKKKVNSSYRENNAKS